MTNEKKTGSESKYSIYAAGIADAIASKAFRFGRISQGGESCRASPVLVRFVCCSTLLSVAIIVVNFPGCSLLIDQSLLRRPCRINLIML